MNPFLIMLDVFISTSSSDQDFAKDGATTTVAPATTTDAKAAKEAGKSAFVLFYLLNSCTQYEVSVIRLLYLNFNCLCLIVFARRMH